MTDLPFLWGAQYYRAPTPDRSSWADDLAQMRTLGFTDVKFWLQWRWGHRRPDSFHFDDLDELLDLAQTEGLRVTINSIFDVAPCWLFRAFPEAKIVRADGRAYEPYAMTCRQIGGMPGPCYRHPGALAARKHFMAAALEHFAEHPAIAMFDVWNEPEMAFPSRTPDPDNIVCYCPTCLAAFPQWLRQRYADDLDHLNRHWGRCYTDWDEIEAPRVADCVVDWLDWRDFQLDAMSAEAGWRLQALAEMAPHWTRYLHVVPDTGAPFNPVSCVDDVAMARDCQVFAATMNGDPQWTVQTCSAGHPKTIYNVECHLNYGSMGMHQRGVDDAVVRRELLPQIGLGVRGILFWQFKSESLGNEAPAWGIVHIDGRERPATGAIERFGRALAPHRATIMGCTPPAPGIAIWKGRHNQLQHYAMHGHLQAVNDSVHGYLQCLYWHNRPLRYVDSTMLDRLDGIGLLILPSPYAMNRNEAAAITAFIEAGGTVLCEAHAGAYDRDRGRHSAIVPGCGLAEAWGIREVDSCAACHLGAIGEQELAGLPPDVAKALRDSGGGGGRFFPIALRDGGSTWGCDQAAFLTAADDDAETLGIGPGGRAMIVSRRLGAGRVVLVGSRWGQACLHDPQALDTLLLPLCDACGCPATAGHDDGLVHVDLLGDGTTTRMVVLRNRAGHERPVPLPGSWRNILDDSLHHGAIPIAAGDCQAYVPA